jgi:hypothetical protein
LNNPGLSTRGRFTRKSKILKKWTGELFYQYFFLAVSVVHCQSKNSADLRTGSERKEVWIPLLTGKMVGLLVNQISRVGGEH